MALIMVTRDGERLSGEAYVVEHQRRDGYGDAMVVLTGAGTAADAA